MRGLFLATTKKVSNSSKSLDTVEKGGGERRGEKCEQRLHITLPPPLPLHYYYYYYHYYYHPSYL